MGRALSVLERGRGRAHAKLSVRVAEHAVDCPGAHLCVKHHEAARENALRARADNGHTTASMLRDEIEQLAAVHLVFFDFICQA